MYIIRLSALLIVLIEGVYGNQCDDCVVVQRCPEVMDLLKSELPAETISLLRSAACGFDTSGKSPKPKVCCSMISKLSTTDETKTVESPEDIRIANHKNLNLLSEDCGYIKIDRIVGGELADLYEFPWMALIALETRYGVDFKCGASIITKRYVLTAAHCVYNKTIVGVRVGEYNILTDIDCQKNVCENHTQDIQVNKSVIHHEYVSTRKGINDIALLRLSEDIDFNHRNVHRICLPTTSELRGKDLSNKNATVTGWGMTEEYADSSVLRKVDIPILPPDNCTVVLSRYINPGDVEGTANQICAGAPTKDSCSGDSGGPLIMEQFHNNAYKYIQYGVVSHGPDKCGSRNPAAYVDVNKYMGWILDNISA